MKTPILFLCSLSLAISAGAQPTISAGEPSAVSASTQPKKTIASFAAGLSVLRTLTIRLNDPPVPARSPSSNDFRPFCHFEVVDERPDTTRIGVHGNLPINSHEFDRQLIFPAPAAQELTNYLNRHFTHPDAPNTVLIVLRQLWLSDADPYLAGSNPYRPVASNIRPIEKTHIRLLAEVYACRDHHYLPLIRIDTLQATSHVTYNTLKSTYNGWEKDLAAIFGDLTENAALAVASKDGAGKWISRDDIDHFNQSRFDIPIFSSPELTRGVYASFDEFRNNTPSIHDFEIKTKNGPALYLKGGDGNSYYTHNAWGYCDGRQVFLMRDGVLQPLLKAGNAFCFYGIEPDDLTPIPGAFGGHNERHCLYVIDMDSGEIY
jgi:hypothetical protein